MTDKKYERYYGQASKAAFENWDSVKKSSLCGCYYCGRIFPSSEVADNDWVPDLHGRTVLCPYCFIDSVIGDASGIPLQKDVLDELHGHWFGGPESEEKQVRCIVSDDCGNLPSRLEHLGVEVSKETDPVKATSEFIPDFYCFGSLDDDRRQMASELRMSGTRVLWLPSQLGAASDAESVALSDVILLRGGSPTDFRTQAGTTDKLLVQTLGKFGLLYRFKDGSWKTLRLTSGEEVDFDATAAWIAAGIVDGIARADKSFEELEDEDIDSLLQEMVRLSLDVYRAGAL